MAVTKITGAGLGLPNADGNALGGASNEWSDLYLADGGVIYFGNDQDVTVTHDPDDGLFLKSTATADDNPFVLTLQTGETDIAANDVIGQIDFQAPDEGQGTDAILVAAGIAAVSEGDFSSSSNATKLSFKTGSSEAATEKMSLSSGGNLDVTGTIQGSTITAETAVVPDASDGAALGTTSLEWSDLYLADGAVIGFGDDQDVTLTHVADTGLLLSSTDQLQFGDSGTYIHQSADGVLDLVSDTELELNATTIDINGNVEISGTATTTGVHTFTAVPVFPNNTVETADIQDNAVTLAKMAGGTDGNIISYDASGDPVAIATGNDGQVLTSTGAGSPPAFEDAAGGGAWTLIGTAVASDSATIGITGINSTYDIYAIGLSDLVPASDNVVANLRLGDSGGIDSGASDYQYWEMNATPDSTSTNVANDASHSSIQLANSVGNGTGKAFGAMLYLLTPADATGRPTVSGTTLCSGGAADDQRGGLVIGQRTAVITTSQIQFLFGSGNVTSGRMTLWGISHA